MATGERHSVRLKPNGCMNHEQGKSRPYRYWPPPQEIKQCADDRDTLLEWEQSIPRGDSQIEKVRRLKMQYDPETRRRSDDRSRADHFPQRTYRGPYGGQCSQKNKNAEKHCHGPYGESNVHPELGRHWSTKRRVYANLHPKKYPDQSMLETIRV